MESYSLFQIIMIKKIKTITSNTIFIGFYEHKLYLIIINSFEAKVE